MFGDYENNDTQYTNILSEINDSCVTEMVSLNDICEQNYEKSDTSINCAANFN